MSVETAGAGAGISVAAPTISVGEVSIGSIAGPSFGSEFSQPFSSFRAPTYSGIPTPEIPTSIITEIPRPLGLEVDTLPEPLTGDFSLADIIGVPNSTSSQDGFLSTAIETTRVEPAIFSNPQIAEETVNPAFVVEPEQAYFTTQAVPETKNGQHESAILAGPDIFPQYSVTEKFTTTISLDENNTITLENRASAQAELSANAAQLESAIAHLVTFGFSQAEEKSWKRKLKMAADLPVVQPEIAIQAQTETAPITETEKDTETSLETKVLLQTDGSFSQKPPSQTANGEEEEPNAAKTTVKEEEWDVYEIGQEWQNAKKTNKKRHETAESIIADAYKSESPKLTVEGSMFALDIPNADESIEIIAGRLKRPEVSPDIYRALSYTDRMEPQQIGGIVMDILKKHPSQKAEKKLENQQRVETRKLPGGARQLAEEGARKIVLAAKLGWKKAQYWKSVKRLTFQKPVEIEHVKAA